MVSILSLIFGDTDVELLPLKDKAENPKQIDNNRIPLYNYYIDVLFVRPRGLIENVVVAPGPHAAHIEGQGLLDPEADSGHDRGVPGPELGEVGCHVEDSDQPDHEEDDRVLGVYIAGALAVDGADGDAVAEDGALGQVELVPGRPSVAHPVGLRLRSSEGHEEHEG